LVYRSDLVVEFRTPPHCEGLGELTPNDQPISGVAILQPEGEDPTVSLLTVRFMPHNDHLASQIIQQFESDELAPEPAPEPPPAASVTASPPVANDKEDPRSPQRVAGVAVFTPAGSEQEFDNLLPVNLLLIPQRGESFGDRLHYAAEDLFSVGFASV
jgi:hypothetical protein